MIFRFFSVIAVIFGFSCLFLYLVNQIPETQAEHSADTNVVNVYTALDKIFSEPLLKKFEQETGIRVNAKYDVEISKTVGLVNQIIAERDNPQCDVFWNNEIIRTIVLDRKKLLQDYSPKNAEGIPEQFRSKRWTGFAARARILIVNTDLLKEKDYPQTSLEFLKPQWKNRFALAKPLFGTTSTHVAALLSLDPKRTRELFIGYKENQVEILAGNSLVKDAVVSGEIPAGWTDTDDASLAIARLKPVRIVIPDQDGSFPGGALLIPNTVSLIKNCPHPKEGQALIEFLLSPETESYLAKCESAQIPLHPNVPAPDNVLKIDNLKLAPIDWEKAADQLENANRFVQDFLLK